MSSDMKDARWGLAYFYAEQENKTFEVCSYPEWQVFLDRAQDELIKYPQDVEFWLEEFRSR